MPDKTEPVNNHWQRYAAEFTGMTDAEIEEESEHCRHQVEEAEDWLAAVASWEAAGKPRAKAGAQ